MLLEAIDSCLKQSQKSLEIIVFDDGSTDGTDELMKTVTDERVHYFRSEKNVGGGRRFGLDRARGKYITFLDHDDYYTDYDFFSKAIQIFEEHENETPPLAIICANAQKHDEINDKRYIQSQWPIGRARGIEDYILNHDNYPKPLSTFPALFRADIVKAATQGRSLEDSMLYLQSALWGDIYYIPDVVGIYRIHADNQSKGVKNNPEYEARYFKGLPNFYANCRYVKDLLYTKANKKLVNRWYLNKLIRVTNFFCIGHPRFIDKLKILRIFLQEAGFMPKLWIKAAFLIPIGLLRWRLRKITPLRKIYRFFKYRLRGKPYPSNF